jgi:hypothetical protein
VNITVRDTQNQKIIMARKRAWSRRHLEARDPGDPSGEATPVPIPNTEVKLSSAEDTEGVAPRENRSSPGSFAFHFTRTELAEAGGLFSCAPRRSSGAEGSRRRPMPQR